MEDKNDRPRAIGALATRKRDLDGMSESEATKTRSGSDNRKRSTPVTTRYDDVELTALREAASRAGLTLASFQRVQSLDQPRTRSTRRPPVERELLARTLGQLGKIGSNLNQIAHQGYVQQIDMAAVEHALGELRDMLPHLMDSLGRKVA